MDKMGVWNEIMIQQIRKRWCFFVEDMFRWNDEDKTSHCRLRLSKCKVSLMSQKLRSHKWEIVFWLKQHMFGVVFIGKMCSCVISHHGFTTFPSQDTKGQGCKIKFQVLQRNVNGDASIIFLRWTRTRREKTKTPKNPENEQREDWGNNFVISKTSFLGGGRVHRKYLVVYMAWISNDTSLLMDSSLSADIWVPLATPPCHGFIIPEIWKMAARPRWVFF